MPASRPGFKPDLRAAAAMLGGEIVHSKEHGDNVSCPGPGHGGKDRSLSVRLDDNAPDGFLTHSFSGDDPRVCRDYVRSKLGLPAPETKSPGDNGSSGERWTVLREHVYREKRGEPHTRVRKLRKPDGSETYAQAHWDGKQWVKGKPKGAKLPYRLPQLIAAPLTSTIYFCEGEKDADNLAKLGFVATTASEGAGTAWDDAMTPHFKDRNVVCLPDADRRGREHAQKVAKALEGVAASVRVVDLFPDRNDGSDVSNWLEDDRVGSRLAGLAKAAPLWEPSAGGADGKADIDGGADQLLIAELAALSRLQYEKRREAAAEQLGVRVSVLDQLVKAAHAAVKDKQPSTTLYPHWEVAPSDEPVAGDALLAETVEEIRRYAFMDDHQPVAAALWIMFSWLHQHERFATHSPILFVTSAEKDSGKSTLLGVVNFLARRSLQSVEISGPALFRSIAKWQPTLIVDEADDALANNADLRSTINSGWTRGQGVIRCHPDTHEPELFSTFAPKVVAMKGRNLPDTTLSRAIVINMKPRRPNDPNEQTADFDHCDSEAFARLRSQLARWAVDNADVLASAVPEIPPDFHNRRRANWKPLLAIAGACGENWKRAGWKAALAIETTADGFDPSIGVQLLAAIKATFETQGTDRITSKELLAALTADETGPWVALGRSQKPITESGVARLLKQFEIRPRTVRTAAGDTAKGYAFAWFVDAFDRHLSLVTAHPPHLAVTPSQVSNINSLEPKQAVTDDLFVTAKFEPNQLKINKCDGVTAEKPSLAVTTHSGVSKAPKGPSESCGQCISHEAISGLPQGDAEEIDPRVCEHCGMAEQPDWPVGQVSVGGNTVLLHRACEADWLGLTEDDAP